MVYCTCYNENAHGASSEEPTLRTNPVHINAPILTGRLKSSFTPMYSMHKYWSRKPSEIIAEYIESYTEPGDIILDAFSGSGVTIIEALKLGRKH